MGKPKAPTPPDPQETAAASTGSNIGTAIAETNLGNVGQVGPGGSLSYGQTGTYTYTDPYTGQTYEIPQFTATTTLSPEKQALYDQMNSALSSRMTDINGLGSFNQSEVESRLNDLGRQRLDPRFERERAALETRLANQGLQPGSAAWEAQMGQFGQTRNDAYNQLALTGNQQAFGQAMQARSQPFNELASLQGGQQMMTPQYNINQPSQIANTDVGGLINANYGQQYQNYQSEMQQRQSLLGGLFGLAAGGLQGGYF
jgi:hypothetical protein